MGELARRNAGRDGVRLPDTMVAIPLTVHDRILEYCTSAVASNPAVGSLTVVCRAWILKLAHVRQVYLLRAAYKLAIDTSDHARCCWQLVEAAEKDWSSEL